jgi:hypothetical protein
MSKDYAAIARAKITRPSAGGRQPRYLVYGRNKKGKTRFCASAPNVLILDPEDGTREELKLDPDTWPITKWQDLEDAYGAVKSGINLPKTNQPIQWVALDGMTKFLSMALDFVSTQQAERDLTRKPGMIDQRTYGQANKMIEGLLFNFHSLRNIGLILTAQERMVEIENMEDLGDDEDATPASFMYVPDLSKGARSPLNQVVDVIGRIYVVRGEFERKIRVRGADGKARIKTVTSRAERRLWIGPHEMYDTGYRSGYDLPDFIKNPNVASLTQAMREGKVSE